MIFGKRGRYFVVPRGLWKDDSRECEYCMKINIILVDNISYNF